LERDTEFVRENLKVLHMHEGILEIERNTREQSDSTAWYAERSKRLTALNFGAVLKRRKSIYA
jgi:hypothetical protein